MSTRVAQDRMHSRYTQTPLARVLTEAMMDMTGIFSP